MSFGKMVIILGYVFMSVLLIDYAILSPLHTNATQSIGNQFGSLNPLYNFV